MDLGLSDIMALLAMCENWQHKGKASTGFISQLCCHCGRCFPSWKSQPWATTKGMLFKEVLEKSRPR